MFVFNNLTGFIPKQTLKYGEKADVFLQHALTDGNGAFPDAVTLAKNFRTAFSLSSVPHSRTWWKWTIILILLMLAGFWNKSRNGDELTPIPGPKETQSQIINADIESDNNRPQKDQPGKMNSEQALALIKSGRNEDTRVMLAILDYKRQHPDDNTHLKNW